MLTSHLIRRAGAIALGVGLLFATIRPSFAHDEIKAGDIVIEHAWARATPAKSGGVFVTLKNEGATPDRLTGASAKIAEMAGLHMTKNDGGVMKMLPVGGIDIPPHATVALKPGGYHVMLMGLSLPLKTGNTFPLTLTFAKAGPVTVTVKVEAAGAMSDEMTGMDHDRMDHKSGN